MKTKTIKLQLLMLLFFILLLISCTVEKVAGIGLWIIFSAIGTGILFFLGNKLEGLMDDWFEDPSTAPAITAVIVLFGSMFIIVFALRLVEIVTGQMPF